MGRTEVPPNLLPHSLAGRLALGLLSAIYIPPSGLFLFALTFGRPALRSWGDWLARVALWEFFAALLGVSVCGLIWAVAAPRWLPPLAYRCARHLCLTALIPFLILAGMLLWPR